MSDSNNITALRNTYQIKILLQDIKPPIWRRLEVDSRITLDALHIAIQSSMGWFDSHLHHFMDRDGNFFRQQAPLDEFDLGFDDFGVDDSGFDDSGVDEATVLLSDVLHEEKDWFIYEYDFGDDWKHKITLEKILPYQPKQLPVICTKGKRACPPEDCGGPWRYMRLTEVLANPESDPEEFEDLQEWLGEHFDPELFDIKGVNKELKELFETADFNNTSAFEKVLQQLSGDFPESSFSTDLFSESDSDIENIINSLNDTLEIIGDMTDLLDDAFDAFETISKISKDKQVIEIARKMMKRLDE